MGMMVTGMMMAGMTMTMVMMARMTMAGMAMKTARMTLTRSCNIKKAMRKMNLALKTFTYEICNFSHEVMTLPSYVICNPRIYEIPHFRPYLGRQTPYRLHFGTKMILVPATIL